MPELPEGPFSAIVADPPWSFNDKGTRLAPSYRGKQRKADKHYDVLPLNDICQLTIWDICAEDAYLFLWIPAALRESPCFEIRDPSGDWWYSQRKSEANKFRKKKYVEEGYEVHGWDGYHRAVMAAWDFKPTGAEIIWVKGRLDFERVQLRREGLDWLPTMTPKLVLNIGGGHTVRNAHEVCVIGKRGRPTRLDKGVPSVILESRGEHSTKPNAFYKAVERLCPGPYIDLYGRGQRENWTVWGDQA